MEQKNSGWRKKTSLFFFVFYCCLGRDRHPAAHPRFHSPTKLIGRLLGCGLADDLVADAMSHALILNHTGVIVTSSLSDKPLAGGAPLNEEELLRRIIKEEENVDQLRSRVLCGASGHVVNGFIVGVFHHVLDKSIPVVVKTLCDRAQIFVNSPRDAHRPEERVSVSRAIHNALVQNLVVALRLKRADGGNDRANDWGSRSHGGDGSHNGDGHVTDCGGSGDGHFRILYEDIAVSVLVMRTITLIRAYSVQFYP